MSTESSQRALIRKALERGEVLTWKDIFDLCGCKNHGARISELRQQGLRIPHNNQLITIDTRFGKKQIGIYYLEKFYTRDQAIQKRFPDIEWRDIKGRFKPLKNPLKDEEKALVRELYLSGKSLPKIYARFPSVPQHWIYETLREMGVKMRPPGQQSKQMEFGYARQT